MENSNLQNYKVVAMFNRSFTFDGEVYYLNQNYWTTIKAEKGLSDWWVIYYAKQNLMKQVAKFMFKNIRMWKRVYLDNADIKVVRE